MSNITCKIMCETVSNRDFDPETGGPFTEAQDLWVFGLERIERERRDLVDWEGLAWGGPLPSWRMP